MQKVLLTSGQSGLPAHNHSFTMNAHTHTFTGIPHSHTGVNDASAPAYLGSGLTAGVTNYKFRQLLEEQTQLKQQLVLLEIIQLRMQVQHIQTYSLRLF